MPAKSLQEVLAALKKEDIPQDIPEEIPEERGEFREPPQPGSYRFRMPVALENCFDLVEVTQKDGEGKPVLGPDGKALTYQRVNLILDGPNALVITQSPGGKRTGEPFTTRISNIERPRFAGKGATVKVSDMTYLLRAVAPDARPRTNQEFIDLCTQLLSNREFGADVEWSGFCNDKKDAYFQFEAEDGGGGVVYETAKAEGTSENVKGCGTRVYQSKWPHDANGYAERMQCPKPGCGAWLRPFAQLVRFKA